MTRVTKIGANDNYLSMLKLAHAAARTLLTRSPDEQDAMAALLGRIVDPDTASGGVQLPSGLHQLRSSRGGVILDRNREVVLAMRLRRRGAMAAQEAGMDDALAGASFVTTPGGEELAVVSRARYERLATAAAAYAREREAERAEAAAEEALAQAREAAWIDAGRPSVSLDVLRRVRAGDSYMKAFRSLRGLTQAQLASRTGLAQGFLSEIENARKPASEETAARIAVALGIHPVFLSAVPPPPDGAG